MPERGQYGFLQALVLKIAYDRLARKERKTRHLRVATHLENEFGPDDVEVVEVVAAHYLEAYNAAPDAEDAAELKASARDRLERAGERAASLAASEEAQRHFAQAAALADEPSAVARLLERAGEMARSGGRVEQAEGYFEQAIVLFEAEGATHPAARVSARLGEVVWQRGRIEEAIERMERSFQVLSGDEPDDDLATLAAQLGRLRLFAGQSELAAERIEFALSIAEPLRLAKVISQALNTKSLILSRRPTESLVLLEGALKIALENDLPQAALRAYNNLAELLVDTDRLEEALHCARSGLALARRRGDRFWEWSMLAQLGEPLFLAGEWDEVLTCAAEIPNEARADLSKQFTGFLRPLTRIHVNRGELADAQNVLAPLSGKEASGDIDARASYAIGRAVVRRAEGAYREAVAAGEEAMQARVLPTGGRLATESLIETAEAAFALDDLALVERLLDELHGTPAPDRTQFLQAQEARFKARLAGRRGQPDSARSSFAAAVARFRELGMPFWLGVALLEHSEWLAQDGQAAEAEPLLAEASEIFERLKARPWLERIERAVAGVLVGGADR